MTNFLAIGIIEGLTSGVDEKAKILIYIGVAAVIGFLVFGLLKRTMWMCVLSLIIAGTLFITQPTVMENIKESVVEFFDGAINPLENEDYSDLVEDENGNQASPNEGYANIGK
jgi:hypothetical protein